MCGLIGAFAFGKLGDDKETVRQVLMRVMTTELLIETEDRGKDATGAAVMFDDGRFFGIKRGESATNFLSLFSEEQNYFGSFVKFWRDNPVMARAYLGHCRAMTTGEKEDNMNNHPIKIGNLVGVHNGVIKNHSTIFEKLKCKRDGKVDSEAIFHLMRHFTANGKEPFTLDAVQEVVRRLDGQFAVMAFNADNPFQIPMFRDNRPLEMVLVRPLKLLFVTSEKKFFDKVQARYERMVNYYYDVLSVPMPSLLSKGCLIDQVLEDDSALILNLNAEINDNTMPKDLGLWRKMSRDKLWVSSGYTSTTRHSYTGASMHTQTTTPETKPTPQTDERKRRVFDKISSKYVLKIGDKVLSETDETVIDVSNSAEETETKTPTANESEATSGVIEEEKTDNPIAVEDVSVYNGHANAITDNKDTETDDDVVEGIILEENSTVNKNDAVVEIDMKVPPPELTAAALAAYDSIPLEDRGFANMSDLINKLDISSVDTVSKMGVVAIANRAHKDGFRNGFVNNAQTNIKESGRELEEMNGKCRRQEKHIASLKTMLLIMSKFYMKMSESNVGGTNVAESKAKLLRKTFNDELSRTLLLDKERIEALRCIFTDYQRYQVREMFDAASDSVSLKAKMNDKES